MLPKILNLFFERIRILPNEDLVKLISKESDLTIPRFIDLLIDLAYDPNGKNANNLAKIEANRFINAMIESPMNSILLKHLFELQGPLRDVKIHSVRGNRVQKSLPGWKQDAIGSLIDQLMLKEKGIMNIVKSVVELTGAANRTVESAFVLARSICKPPRGLLEDDRETHYRNIADQIIDLIRVTKVRLIFDKSNNDLTDIHREYLRFGQTVALECVQIFTLIDRSYLNRFILEPIFSDFYRVLDSNVTCDFNEPEIVLDSEKLIDILHLQTSLLNTYKPTATIVRWLRTFSPVILSILNTVKDKSNQYKTACKEILIKLTELSHTLLKDAQKFVRSLSNLDSMENARHLHRKLIIRGTISNRDEFEIAVNIDSLSIESESLTDNLSIIGDVVDVLIELPESVRSEVVSGLCIWLLEQRLNVDAKKEETSDVLIMSSDINDRLHSRKFRDTLLFMLVTKMESNCFTKSYDILKFAQIAINQYSKIRLNSSVEGVTEKDIRENLDYALNMIVCVITRGDLPENVRGLIQEIFPVLTQLLSLCNPSDSTSETIMEICTVIATHGYVNPINERKSLLIEESTDRAVDDPDLKEALDAVRDESELSYKGFGLVKLRLLLEERRESAMKHRVKIYDIFCHYLFHEDPCIYLRAIRGLALLGDRFTEKLLPVIARKITAARQNTTVEEWIVLGEVFMKIISNLGQMAPCYRDLVLNCLSPHLKDPDELIRASAVANIGHLCCQLDYAFSPVMQEIAAIACGLLEHDNSSHVRVASAIMIRKLILGQLDNSGKPRPDIWRLSEIIKLLRECFSKVFMTESNETVLDHVSVANKALSDSIKTVPFVSDSFCFNTNISIGNSDIGIQCRKLNF